MKRFLAVVLAASCGVAVGADPMPDVVPAVKVPYEDVLRMVKAGGELKVAFGVAAPAGYVRVDDVPAGVKPGLWRCWKDADGAKMHPAEAAKAVARTPVLQYPVLPNVQNWLGTNTCRPGMPCYGR